MSWDPHAPWVLPALARGQLHDNQHELKGFFKISQQGFFSSSMSNYAQVILKHEIKALTSSNSFSGRGALSDVIAPQRWRTQE